ncbi:MAG: DUF885 family protein [Cyanobacteria bacterium REEB67]|nr:DUF885 family protein [Cyanobacteria bacterium REEB67]
MTVAKFAGRSGKKLRGVSGALSLCLAAAPYLPLFAADVSVHEIKMSGSSSAGGPTSSDSVIKQLDAVKQSKSSIETDFDLQEGRFFDFLFAASPSWGTNVGLHEYDNKLEDFSAAAQAGNLKRLREFKALFEDLAASPAFAKVPLGRRNDLALIQAAINAQILDYEHIRSLQRDPDKYSSLIADSVFSLTKRNFASLEKRLLSITEREKLALTVLKQARENLVASEVPRIYAEVALEQLPGAVEMVKVTIPAAFKDVKETMILKKYHDANDALIKALGDYETFIKVEILPKTKPDFAIGRDNFVKKLAYDEMETEDLDVLLKRGYDELHRLQKRFKEVAYQINPKLSTSACFEEISKHHPRPERLVSGTASVLDGLRSFCLDKGIVSIPSKEQVTVAETPSFLRALTFASMDTPGPYESQAKEAYYYVTPAEKEWDAKRIEEHMRFYSYPDLINTSVHEAYPGHYVQFLWEQSAPSKTRKLLGCSSNAEGWAHYCEEMMIQEGLPAVAANLIAASDGGKSGGADAGAQLELVQLHDALLRACRYIVGIEMHCKGMTYDQGIAFFTKEGYMEKANAERETKRGTKDATYMVYTLGKLKILQLREDYKKMRGDKYSLKDFHDRFLRCGFPPLKVVRSEMLEASTK